MSLFFETLKVTAGKIENLDFHNLRLNHAIQENFHFDAKIDLQEHIIQKDITLERCKVSYTKEIEKVAFFPLRPRHIHSLKILHSDISYNFKYTNRDDINALFEKRENCDDIIMIKEGLATDTSIANIAIYDGLRWITPKNPLLKGTFRASMLKKQLLLEKDVKIKDIEKSTRFALMNALIGFQEIKGVNIKF